MMEDAEYLNIEKNYIFEKTIQDSELFLIAIDVINRLQNELKQLNQSDDFIAYVSAADGVGGDGLTLSQLIRKCVPKDQLYKAMPDLKQKDQEFYSIVEEVRQLSLSQQIEHWINVIEGGEFDNDSMWSFRRTDYESHAQLVELGSTALPIIQELMKGELKQDTEDILEMVVEDLQDTSEICPLVF